MTGKILDLLFGCHHRLITRPITQVRKYDCQPSYTYVACLECGKQFYYDTRNMRVGTPIPVSLMMPNRASYSFQSQQ